MITSKGHELSLEPAKKGPKDKVMRLLGNANFQNALKLGYLFKRADSLFRDWSEKFCVLTNVGLLYYDDPNKRPKNLFPVIDSRIETIPSKVHFTFRDFYINY